MQVLDFFSEDNAHFLAMELVDGKNFGEAIRKGDEEFALADIVDWGEQILEALHYIHKKSPPIVYFNLRPPNLHLTENGKIKLLATGIGSKPDENGRFSRISFDTANLCYSPLELIWQKLDTGTQRVILNGYDERAETMLLLPPDERCDIYSVGATIYQLMTNQVPKDALERSIEILEGKSDPLEFPHELNSSISVEISEFVVKSLAISRDKRFQSVQEMRNELQSVYAKLREHKAQLLRSEVPAAPSARTVHQQLLEKSLLTKEVNESVAQTESEISDNSESHINVVGRPRAVPEFGMDLDLLEMNVEPTLKEALTVEEFKSDFNNSIPVIDEFTASEKFVADEQWQEEFENEVASSSNWQFEENPKEDSDEFQYLFGTQKPESKLSKRLAIAAFGAVIIGGGAFGVFKFLPSASAESPQQTLAAPIPVQEPQTATEIQPENAPIDSAEQVETQTSEFASEDQTPGKVDPAEIQPQPKTKDQPTQIATIKKPEPSKAASANEKKKVTVDDLINDTPKRKVTVDDLITDN